MRCIFEVKAPQQCLDPCAIVISVSLARYMLGPSLCSLAIREPAGLWIIMQDSGQAPCLQTYSSGSCCNQRWPSRRRLQEPAPHRVRRSKRLFHLMRQEVLQP